MLNLRVYLLIQHLFVLVLTSSRKAGRNEDPFRFYQKSVQENPHERCMYDKFLMYNGAEEYSFEEIRAIKHLRIMKEREMQGR